MDGDWRNGDWMDFGRRTGAGWLGWAGLGLVIGWKIERLQSSDPTAGVGSPDFKPQGMEVCGPY
jgi:hypothetical protein